MNLVWTQPRDEPVVKSVGLGGDRWFTLLVSDPDARPPSFVHLKRKNVHFVDGKLVDRGRADIPWFPPTPPKRESHRYVVSLVPQPQGQSGPPRASPERQGRFVPDAPFSTMKMSDGRTLWIP